MEATLNLNYNQILNLVMQMPLRSQLRLGRTLTRKSTEKELRHFLDTFKTDKIKEEDILAETKAVRKARYASRHD